MSGPSVAVKGLGRRFNGRAVLSSIDLELGAGSVTALVGPSGSGKTTLVRLISGCDRPDSGTVTVLGRPMPDLAVLAQTGYMAQADALYLELSARENLAFFGGLFGLGGADLKDRTGEVLAMVDLASDADRPVLGISGGMKRRLSLAIALLHRPRILRSGKVDAVLSMRNRKPHLWMKGSDPVATLAVGRALAAALRATLPIPLPEPEIAFLHGTPGMNPFDNFGPVLLGFLVFFFTFIVSGISFVRERQTGTLERMLATPVRRHEVLLGYLLGFAAIVVLQSTLMTAHSLFVLGMMLEGSVVWLLVIVLLLAATALSLGMLLSAYARTEFQMLQFIPLVIVPQIFFSGIFPVASMPRWLAALGRAFPLTYAADAMREVMIRGGGWNEIRGDLLVLAGLAALLVAANIRALRRYRPI